MSNADPIFGTRQPIFSGRRRRCFWWLAAGEALLVAVFAGIGLGHSSVAVDEGFAAVVARTPPSTFWDIITQREANQVLHYLVLRFTPELGSTEGYLRLPSVLSGAFTVVAMAAVGRRVDGLRTGILAGALLAFNGFFIAHARFARSYALALLLVTLSVLCLLRAIERPSRVRLTAWAFVSTLAVYSHFFAALVLMAEAIAVGLHPDRRQVLRSFRRATFAVLGMLSPLLLFVLTTPGNQVDWIPATTLRTPFQLAYSLSGRGGVLLTGALAVSAGCGILQLFTLLKRRQRAQAWPLVLAATWFTIPVVLTLAASAFKPLAYDSFLIISLPGLLLLAAAGLSGVRPLNAFLAVAIVALGARSIVVSRDYKLIQDWRSAAAFVLERADPDDALLVGFLDERAPLEYYVTRWGRTGNAPTPVIPTDRWGGLVPKSVARPELRDRDVAGLMAFNQIVVVHRSSASGPHSTSFPLPPSEFRLIETRLFFHVDVRIYEPRGATTG